MELPTLFLLIVALSAVVVQSDDVGSRIVGGTNANIANHPWQASLRYNNQHSCGAVLIGGQRAVTASHCGGAAVNTYGILAGTTDRTTQTCQTCVYRPLLAFIRHPGFVNNPTQGYPADVAVLTFNNMATNVNVQYATLAVDESEDFVGQTCTITGWGRQQPTEPLPTTLQQSTMSIVTAAECIEVWGINRIRDEQLCAISPASAMCAGDNGGPLTCGGVLAGIFSWSEAGCSPLYPSVFIRMSYYNDWITGQ